MPAERRTFSSASHDYREATPRLLPLFLSPSFLALSYLFIFPFLLSHISSFFLSCSLLSLRFSFLALSYLFILPLLPSLLGYPLPLSLGISTDSASVSKWVKLGGGILPLRPNQLQSKLQTKSECGIHKNNFIGNGLLFTSEGLLWPEKCDLVRVS